MSVQHTVLIVDDEEFVRDSLVELLRSEGYRAVTARNKNEAMRILHTEAVSAIVTDLRMPAGDGIALLEDVRREGITAPVILLTGVGTIADAVASMKAGAFDFIEKPVDPGQFVHMVRRAVEHRDLKAEVHFLRDALRDLRGPTEMVGSSRALEEVRLLIEQVAGSDATVLVMGESGTGKELVAAEIHRRSRRADRNLVRVNCAAVSESLFESEFFGHRRGAFTGAVGDREGRFAEAEGGTLVLDEIGTLRPEMQAKLLRVLETGEYQVVGESRTRVADVRLIAVTNEELPDLVRSGRFRADLFFRLNVFPITVPPLRERPEDVAAIAAYFLRRLRPTGGDGEDGDAGASLGDDAIAVLEEYDWPGNVRELRNVIERATILSPSKAPDGRLFAAIVGPPGENTRSRGGKGLKLRERLDAVERELVEEALARTSGRKAEAARLLGVDPKNLSYYLRKHGVGDDVSAGGETSQ